MTTDQSQSATTGHEPDTTNVGTAVKFAIGLMLALIVIQIVIVIFMAVLHGNRESESTTVQPPVTREPDWQAADHWRDPAGDLAKLRDREESALTTYEWIDNEKGIVRIPITEAMKMISGEPSNNADQQKGGDQ
jgi:hypothetical protein